MKKVIVTTSWDDGHILDMRLSELLMKYGIKGTFYIAPHDIETDPANRLTEAQIKMLSKNFEIGAHTMSHAHLTRLPDNEARKEIEKSKQYLKKVIDREVTSFCYPRGEYTAKHVAMTQKAGYTYARTVNRFNFGKRKNPLEAATSVNTYNHYSDLWKIARFAKFNPIQIYRYLHWDILAKEMFDRVLITGGEFHLWGHSWEIEEHGDWEKLESVLAYISQNKKVEYLNNSELPKQEPKKLVIIAPYFLPHMGGVEFYIYNIARKLQTEYGWDICIITTGDKGYKVNIETFEGIKIYRLQYWFKLSNAPLNLMWPLIVRQILKDECADVINIHAPVPGLPDIGAWVSGSTPVIVTYHAGSMKKGVMMIVDAIIWMYENGPLKWMLKKSDKIVCSSNFVRNDFLKNFQYKSITITPGVDGMQFRPSHNSTSDSNSVLFVAGLSRSQKFKGLFLLIDAIKIVSDTVPSINLVVVGEGDMKSEYEEYVKKVGLEGKVIFTGKLTGEPLIHVYQEADVFVLPSNSPAESFGMVIVEAMACGKPVIGTNLGGIPDVIEDGKNGILIPEKNVKALSIAIIKILLNKELAESFGKNGLEKARSIFDWGTRVNEYDKLFSRTINKKRHVAQIAGYYPPHLGGLEVVAREISLELANNNHSVTVLTSNITDTKGPVVDDDDKVENYKVQRLKCLELAHTPIMWALPWKLLWLPRKSIVHVHVAHAGIPEVAFLISKFRKFPIVAHFHLDIGPSGSLGWLLPFYKKYILGFVLRRVNKIIVFSETQSQLVQEKYQVKESNITIIPNGVGEDFFFRDPRPTPTKRLQLLYVGRISVQKRVDRLIDILPLLKIPVYLTIVGDGEDRSKLELHAHQLGLTNVSFEGKKSGEELRAYYRKADLFIIASDVEGMPLVVLEAMAAGLPIVASNVLGLNELVEGIGVLVDKPSPQTFADTLTDLWKNPKQLQKLSKQSLEKAEQHSWKILVNKLEEVYITL